ncbi:thiol-disulfide isomerase/thioredoxin [Salirhabdus euzebyi]|uniref:Thiol-disulfide isomerase/thioredoxin n=1 Tax=Salirhabdus euzebyi TaxID=394506 RepID=A0A841Q8F4_9BACI|nr:thioredoxin family protein [Salirhabdus euzebyi]MBB6454688.1 thiol-disulfide isomerase/thioredoxin [Salirhabdus euzebyi]
MKKIIIFSAIIIVLFGALIAVVQYQKAQEPDYYQNQITPSELEETLSAGESATIYFYSPECQYCLETTPVLVPLAEEMGVNVQLLNVLEYGGAWDEYALEGTPTLIHFENGEEEGRVQGSQPKENFESFFNDKVLQ